MSAAFRLTPEQYRILWTDLGLGGMPYPLDVPGTATSLRADDLWSELGDAGDRLEGLLRLLGDHVLAVDVVADQQGLVRGLSATDGTAGVLAVIRHDAVELTAIDPAAVVPEVLGVLQNTKAGKGNPVSVRVTTMRAAEQCDEDDYEDDRPWGREPHAAEREVLARAGVAPSDAAVLSDLINNRTAGGQLGVTCGAVRSPEVITWFDTRSGRYLVVSDDGWLKVTPAGNTHITSRIDEIVSAAHKEGVRNV
ncbi:ESX secretion-associated protein EspG [Lentzea sp. NBRC 105346]|uniref:ESX secretion-associated protein EspG n=1 Tax=Lentzea sp. NBRC 105346 TaxID=3032205 RepID=UPI0024A53A00|nr:ESX secretion-associated protein EspG [Lentzea sp. NBRC 105346]GLZ27990.1 ESX secretion-associated protein EspG [Lentzea sp. NBRC 105346]